MFAAFVAVKIQDQITAASSHYFDRCATLKTEIKSFSSH